MRRRSTHAAVVFTIFLSVTVSSARASDTDIVTVLGPTASVDWEAITAAVETLPSQPIRIAVMDVTQNRPDVRNYLLSLDAFTVAGNGVIYHCPAKRDAQRRADRVCSLPRDAGRGDLA